MQRFGKCACVFLLVFVLSILAVPFQPEITAYAKTTNLTLTVGDTKYLFPRSDDSDYAKRTVNSGSWRSMGVEYVEVISNASTPSSCQIRAKKATTSPIILRLDYYYWITSGTYRYLASGYVDYMITVQNVQPESVSLPDNISLDRNEKRTLNPTLRPSNAVSTYTWSSNNRSVAQVNSNGVVTGIADGTAKITVTTRNGKSDSCIVTVKHTCKWGDWKEIKAPACTEDGTLRRSCSICGAYQYSVKEAAGHQLIKTPAKKATTTSNGNILYWTCSVCGKYYRDEAAQEEISLSDTIINKVNSGTGKNDDDTSDTTASNQESVSLKDDSSDAVYRTVDPGSGNQIEYIRPVDSKKKIIIIPDTATIDGVTYRVTEISANAFKGNTSVTRVVIGKNITTIASKAFYGCKNLKTVDMGTNVKIIGSMAFYKCSSLTRITIPGKTSKIGKKAFYGCKKLKSIKIKSTRLTLKKIGSNAFKGTYSKGFVRVPKAKLKTYKKILRAKGLSKKVKFIS